MGPIWVPCIYYLYIYTTVVFHDSKSDAPTKGSCVFGRFFHQSWKQETRNTASLSIKSHRETSSFGETHPQDVGFHGGLFHGFSLGFFVEPESPITVRKVLICEIGKSQKQKEKAEQKTSGMNTLPEVRING